MNEFSNADILALLRSPAGQQLLAMLQRQNSETLEKAKSFAQAGNYAEVKKVMASMLNDPQVAGLLQQLGGGKLE